MLWRERVRKAQDRYLDAKAASARVSREQVDRLTPSPDGEFAARQAIKTEVAALAEYTRTLKIFSSLVIHGKMPEDPPASA